MRAISCFLCDTALPLGQSKFTLSYVKLNIFYCSSYVILFSSYFFLMGNAIALTPCCRNEDDANALALHENLVSLIGEKENMQSHPYVGRTS